MYTNKVKSVLRNKKSGNIVLRYFDNLGQVKQKQINLPHTKRNVKKMWREIVPAFEIELQKRVQEAELKESKEKVDSRLCVYTHKYREQLKAVQHTKEKTHAGRTVRMEKYFGYECKLEEITELQIEEFFQTLTCKRVSKLDWLVPVRKVFELARKANAIEKNIVNSFKLPIENSDEDTLAVEPFSTEEIKKLLASSSGTELHNYLGIAFHIGARPQEIVALKIDDIDFENMLVHISRAITHGKYKKTKTDGSTRSVPLPNQAKKFFEEQIEFAKSKGTTFIFSFSNGMRLNDISDIRGRADRKGPWYALIEKSEVQMRDLRQTRHTFAVQAIKSGMYTLQEVSAVLGHSSLSMLFRHYGKHLGKSHLKINREVDIFDGLGYFLGYSEEKTVNKK